MDSVLGLVLGHKISVNVQDDKTMNLEAFNDEGSVNIKVHLSEGSLENYINSDFNDDTAAELLFQILSNTGI